LQRTWENTPGERGIILLSFSPKPHTRAEWWQCVGNKDGMLWSKTTISSGLGITNPSSLLPSVSWDYIPVIAGFSARQ
jgi:hypothetical protein